MKFDMDRIEVNPQVCHGKPVVRGTRILVSQVLGAFAAGDSVSDILEDYPSLTRDVISLAHALRNKNNVKIRQPLSTLRVAAVSKESIPFPAASHPTSSTSLSVMTLKLL